MVARVNQIHLSRDANFGRVPGASFTIPSQWAPHRYPTLLYALRLSLLSNPNIMLSTEATFKGSLFPIRSTIFKSFIQSSCLCEDSGSVAFLLADYYISCCAREDNGDVFVSAPSPPKLVPPFGPGCRFISHTHHCYVTKLRNC